MKERMGTMLGRLKDTQTNAPKEMIRENQTPDGARLWGIGQLVYDYSITVGPDGKPKARVFECNVNWLIGLTTNNTAGMAAAAKTPKVTDEGKPLVGVNTTDKEVKAVLEIPVVKKMTLG